MQVQREESVQGYPLWVVRRSKSHMHRLRSSSAGGSSSRRCVKLYTRIINVGQKLVLLSSFFLDGVGISDKKESLVFFLLDLERRNILIKQMRNHRDLIWTYVNVHLLNAYECISVNVFGCVSSFGKPKFVKE